MRNLNRLESYALAATAVTASITSVGTAAVVSTSANISVPLTSSGIYLNVLTGQSSTSPAAVSGWDVNPYGSSSLSFFNPAGDPSTTGVARLGASPTSANTNVANVAGLTIGNLGGMWFTTTGTAVSTSAPAGRAFVLNSSNNYVGFRFLNEATNAVHYGYLRFQIGAALTSRTLIEFAYEDVAGASIQVPVPAPGAIALLGLAGLVGTRRRRS
jgi:MYXO-CTERM domain-containing protein